ncbi:HAD hydrolase-like protein, partial [bacterium]|nr:HAD hydrolase-like protein [bacterium]
LKQTFFDLIYQERERLFSQHPKMWIQLNPLYRGMKEFISKYADREQLAIISTKKQTFIHRILEGNGIDFSMQRIFQAGHDQSKSEIILDLLKKNRLEPTHLIFVDDQVDTLIKMKHTGVNRYLAGWGYNNDTQKTRARDACISVLTLDEFYQSVMTLIINEKYIRT